MPRSAMAGLYGMFSFVRIAKLFFRMAMPFYIPISNVWKTSSFSELSTAFNIVTVFYTHSSNRYVILFHCDFSHIWLIICFVADNYSALLSSSSYSHIPFPFLASLVLTGLKNVKKKNFSFSLGSYCPNEVSVLSSFICFNHWLCSQEGIKERSSWPEG